MTRDERQKECIRRWVKAGGNASIVASTGFGFNKNCIFRLFFIYLYINLNI